MHCKSRTFEIKTQPFGIVGNQFCLQTIQRDDELCNSNTIPLKLGQRIATLTQCLRRTFTVSHAKGLNEFPDFVRIGWKNRQDRI
jgi:hypothetical protein